MVVDYACIFKARRRREGAHGRQRVPRHMMTYLWEGSNARVPLFPPIKTRNAAK